MDNSVLDLSKKKIDRIEAASANDVFARLDIDAKNITYVNKLSSAIVFLYLGENNLKYISEGTFDALPLLEHLDLSSNKIVKVDLKAFVKCKNLQTLDLSHNSLKNVALEFIKSVELDLNNNVLETVSIEVDEVASKKVLVRNNELQSFTLHVQYGKPPAEFTVFCDPPEPTLVSTNCIVKFVSDSLTLPPTKYFQYLSFSNYDRKPKVSIAAKPLSIILADTAWGDCLINEVYTFLEDYNSNVIRPNKTADEYNDIIYFNRYVCDLEIMYYTTPKNAFFKRKRMIVPLILAGSHKAMCNPTKDRSALDKFVFGLVPSEIRSCSKEKYFSTAVDLFTASSVSQMARAISNKLDLFNSLTKYFLILLTYLILFTHLILLTLILHNYIKTTCFRIELVVEEDGRVAYRDTNTQMLFDVESLSNIRKLKIIFAIWEFASKRYEIPFTPLVLFSMPRDMNCEEIAPVLHKLGENGIQLIITIDSAFISTDRLRPYYDSSTCGLYTFKKA